MKKTIITTIIIGTFLSALTGVGEAVFERDEFPGSYSDQRDQFVLFVKRKVDKLDNRLVEIHTINLESNHDRRMKSKIDYLYEMYDNIKYQLNDLQTTSRDSWESDKHRIRKSVEALDRALTKVERRIEKELR